MALNGSTIVRRQLGRRLRQLRERAGKTVADVEAAKLASAVKLWRIENGKTRVKVADARALCWLYGADEPTTQILMEMAAGSAQQGWWEDYDGVMPEWFGLYLGLEGQAAQIKVYEPELVPGIFQTPEYAQAVYCTGIQPQDPTRQRRYVDMRMRRQRAVFQKTTPTQVAAIISAGVLHRSVGGPTVMEAQIERMREMSHRDQVDLRVITWDSGAHPAMLGAFTVLDFDDPDDPAVVYLETHVGCQYLEQESQLAEYRKVFSSVHRRSISLEEYMS
jgi:transcriptional regulator with XRE-family HTH domain